MAMRKVEDTIIFEQRRLPDSKACGLVPGVDLHKLANLVLTRRTPRHQVRAAVDHSFASREFAPARESPAPGQRRVSKERSARALPIASRKVPDPMSRTAPAEGEEHGPHLRDDERMSRISQLQ